MPGDRLRSGLARLPFSRMEADAIASLAPSGSVLKATDFNASVRAATAPSVADYRIVHFATHGVLDTRTPELSGLVLSLENVHDWPVLRDVLRAEVPGLSAEDEGIGAVSVVGTGLAASHRVLREVTAALEALGAPPRAIFTSSLRVTACCDARVLKDAAREIHARVIR